jgi:phage shock protein PspC (stress-responsive transcriptional regulator)
MVGGVATGLAAYLGIDVVVVRIAFVVLAFIPFPGFGALVYVAMLLLVPVAEGDAVVPAAELAHRGAGFWVGIVLVGLATFWFIGAGVAVAGGIPGPFRGGLFPLVLIGLGVALWVDADRRGSDRVAAGAEGAPGAAPGPGAEASPPPAEDPVWASTSPAQDPPGPPTPPAPAAPIWQPPPVVRRPRSPLGRVTLGLALLAGGVAWLVDLLELATVRPSAILATVLVVLGLGLLVGSVLGRARWLALLVAVMLPMTAAAVALEDLDIDLRSGVGSRTVTVVDAAELGAPLRHGAGELLVDLRGLDDPDGAVLDATLGAGELQIWLPEGAGLRGTTRLEAGELEVFGTNDVGLSIDRDHALPSAPGRPTFEVDLRVGAGVLIVVRDLDPLSEDPEVRR